MTLLFIWGSGLNGSGGGSPLAYEMVGVGRGSTGKVSVGVEGSVVVNRGARFVEVGVRSIRELFS